MLRKAISIAVVGIAVLTLMVSTILPHHHHEEGICFAVEHCCEQEEPVDCKHTDGEEGHSHSCIAGIDYIDPQASGETKCKLSACENPDHTHFCPLLSFLVADFLCSNQYSTPKLEYGEYISPCHAAGECLVRGLRAPPSFC